MNHLMPGKWEMGKNIDSIVTAEPFEGCCNEKTAEYYGGYLVAESVPACFRSLIIAAPEMYEALTAMVEEVELLRDGETCDHIVGVCWCDYFEKLCRAHTALKKAMGEK